LALNSPQCPETNTPGVTTVIEADSRAQALDWSLVLISQGIESVVLQRLEDGAWVVEVAASEWRRAAESIAAYERENATVWRHELKWTGLLFDARAVIWFVALALFHFFVVDSRIDFKAAGMVDRTAVLHGEWWRLFTAVTLHADVAHLIANVTTGIVFLGLAMGCFGAGAALLLSFVGGVLGNVATLALHDGPFRSLGASGMVMAALGLLTAHSLMFSRHERRALWIGRGVIASCLLVVLLGLSPKSDVVAHLGGFVAGAALGIIALRYRSGFGRRWFNVAAVMICAMLVVLTWALALRG
jgi:membrane associated rhomboid family serine protease